MADVDVIVMGVGTCGEDLSLRLLGEGLKVVGIEPYLVGGECAYWACLPSKLMIRAGNLLAEGRRVNGKAGTAEIRPDWGLLAKRVRAEVTGGWDGSYGVARFEGRGGRLIKGYGRLDGPRSVVVNGERITARLGVVLATGSKFIVPPVAGLNEVNYWGTHDLIGAETLPDSLIVLGGGFVGCELGQLMARFGAEVTIIEQAENLLPNEEPEAGRELAKAFEAEGIRVLTGVAAERVSEQDGQIRVSLSDSTEVVGERLLVATGKRPNVNNIGLETVGLDPAAGLVPTDERLRAGDGLWAMGDVTGKMLLTHVALYQSMIIAADILGLERDDARYDAVPRVTLTDPEVGSVGLTEAEAKAAGMNVISVVKGLPGTFRGWLHGSGNGILKFVVANESGRLVGATAVGPRGGEMLGMLTLAIHAGISIRELQNMIYPFPSFDSAIGEAIGAYGRGLSTVIDPPYKGFEELDKTGN
jgi:pyruvate/2-oxoglutarate dehydrogenase complex dihydrolipoamide dehydrogenase (E3) component